MRTNYQREDGLSSYSPGTRCRPTVCHLEKRGLMRDTGMFLSGPHIFRGPRPCGSPILSGPGGVTTAETALTSVSPDALSRKTGEVSCKGLFVRVTHSAQTLRMCCLHGTEPKEGRTKGRKGGMAGGRDAGREGRRMNGTTKPNQTNVMAEGY